MKAKNFANKDFSLFDAQRSTYFNKAQTRCRRTKFVDFVKVSPIEEKILVVSNEKSAELLALDEALKNLEKMDPQKAKIVELRYFGGLSIEETAEVTGVSSATVNRQWRMAKAWLYGQISNS